MPKPALLFIGNHFSDGEHNQNAWQDLAYHLRKAGYSVITTSAKKNKILRLWDMLNTILRRRNDYELVQVDVFSGPAFMWAFLSVLLAKKLHKPVILTLHGGNLPEYARSHLRSVKWLLNQAEAVTAPSGYLQEAMRPYRKDIQLIPNALDISKYPFKLRKHAQPQLIWLRAFHRIYNPELAIRLVHILKKEYPDIHLIMVGPDKGDGSLQNCQVLAAELGVADRVEFSGKVAKADVPGWLNIADIFINTTNYDNTPVSVMEAMACGLCVVSTNVGGMPYLLENEVNGLLVDPQQPEEMARAVKNLLKNPDLAEKLSMNARKNAEKFDWVFVISHWEAILLEVGKKSKN